MIIPLFVAPSFRAGPGGRVRHDRGKSRGGRKTVKRQRLPRLKRFVVPRGPQMPKEYTSRAGHRTATIQTPVSGPYPPEGLIPPTDPARTRLHPPGARPEDDDRAAARAAARPGSPSGTAGHPSVRAAARPGRGDEIPNWSACP